MRCCQLICAGQPRYQPRRHRVGLDKVDVAEQYEAQSLITRHEGPTPQRAHSARRDPPRSPARHAGPGIATYVHWQVSSTAAVAQQREKYLGAESSIDRRPSGVCLGQGIANLVVPITCGAYEASQQLTCATLALLSNRSLQHHPTEESRACWVRLSGACLGHRSSLNIEGGGCILPRG